MITDAPALEQDARKWLRASIRQAQKTTPGSSEIRMPFWLRSRGKGLPAVLHTLTVVPLGRRNIKAQFNGFEVVYFRGAAELVRWAFAS